MTYTCYINGQFTSSENAKINAYDIGFTRAHAAFECFCVYDRKPFLLKEHLKRLKYSCDKLYIHYPQGSRVMSKKQRKEIFVPMVKKACKKFRKTIKK